MTHYQNKVVAITGAASGIGKGFVDYFTQAGADVILLDVSPRTSQLAEELRDKGFSCTARKLDVVDKQSFEDQLLAVVEEHGRLDILINCAGIAVLGSAEDVSFEQFKKVIDVDLMGVIHGSLAAYNIMIKQKSGQIINIASLAGLIPSALGLAYSTAKPGVVGFSESLRLEASFHNVKVNVVCPSFVDTAILDSPKENMKESAMAAIVRQAGGKISVEACIEEVMRAIDKNQARIVVPRSARTIFAIFRYFPESFRRLVLKAARKIRKFRIEEI